MIKAILFDLGNVLATFDERIACRKWAEISPYSEEEIYKRVFRSPLKVDYESGRMQSHEFYESVTELLDIEVTFEMFREVWSHIFAPNPGMLELTTRLDGKYDIFLLSNTNEMHFEYVREYFEVMKIPRDFVLSYKVGAMKPDARIFQEALEVTGRDPEECLYTDDMEEYVVASRELGFQAIHFRGPAPFSAELRRLRML